MRNRISSQGNSKNVTNRKWTGENQVVILGFDEFVFKFPFCKLLSLQLCSQTD